MSISDEMLEKKVLAMLRKVTSRRFVDLDQTLQEIGVDSIVALELVMKLEREFGISIPDSRLSEMLSPRATLALVRELLTIAQ